MGTTPTYGLRYQELGDAPDGAALGANLAADVETELERIDATNTTQGTRLEDLETATAPFAAVRMASGRVEGVNYPGTGTVSVPVTFPAGRFVPGLPIRVATTITNGNPTGSSGFAACWATNPTSAGMDLNFRRSSADASMGAEWVAVQDSEEVTA